MWADFSIFENPKSLNLITFLGTWTKDVRRTIDECIFYLAYENSNCTEYVTEKFSNALISYAIPIVNGFKESYEKRLPGKQSFLTSKQQIFLKLRFEALAENSVWDVNWLVDKKRNSRKVCARNCPDQTVADRKCPWSDTTALNSFGELKVRSNPSLIKVKWARQFLCAQKELSSWSDLPALEPFSDQIIGSRCHR